MTSRRFFAVQSVVMGAWLLVLAVGLIIDSLLTRLMPSGFFSWLVGLVVICVAIAAGLRLQQRITSRFDGAHDSAEL